MERLMLKTNGSGYKLAAVFGVALMVAGCAGTSILPNTQSRSQDKWASYEEARAAFERVALNQTSRTQVDNLGFAAKDTPNIKVLNYVEVASLFSAAFKPEDLPAGVKSCVKAGEGCFAYVVKAQNIRADRVGSVGADLFGFRKQIRTHGWEFQATLVLVNDVVVYKLWSGTPEVNTFEKQTTPLGPMQNLGGLIPKPF
ncbi:MAG: hypothetical protein EBR79_01205 [Proteobacteria bacterium]|nr:hypothetical protein [Pseudomonadota bacterium]NBX86143.1 hypothetical protein [Pseudomonadota bacterium]